MDAQIEKVIADVAEMTRCDKQALRELAQQVLEIAAQKVDEWRDLSSCDYEHDCCHMRMVDGVALELRSLVSDGAQGETK